MSHINTLIKRATKEELEKLLTNIIYELWDNPDAQGDDSGTLNNIGSMVRGFASSARKKAGSIVL